MNPAGGRDHARRAVDLHCGECGTWTHRALEGDPPDTLACGKCAAEQALDWGGHLDAGGALDGCPACGFPRLCIQTDFNRKFGLAVVIVTYATLLFLGVPVLWLVGGLALLALADWLLLRFVVRRFLMCYRCQAQYRGFAPGPRCRPFDLATWEGHRQARAG